MARDSIVNKSSIPSEAWSKSPLAQVGLPEEYEWIERQYGCNYAQYLDSGWTLETLQKEKLIKRKTTIKQQEEVNMNNTARKTVTVNLIDRDSALDDKHALVAAFGEFTTTKSGEALIRSIIMEPDNQVAAAIAEHNKVRVAQVNREILNRTGNKVMLEPVEESDLFWEIQ